MHRCKGGGFTGEPAGFRTCNSSRWDARMVFTVDEGAPRVDRSVWPGSQAALWARSCLFSHRARTWFRLSGVIASGRRIPWSQRECGASCSRHRPGAPPGCERVPDAFERRRELGEVTDEQRSHRVALDPVDAFLRIDLGAVVDREEAVRLEPPRRHQDEDPERGVAEPEAL